MNLRLAGKRAVVTGSTAGIGAGIVRALAREGAVVVVQGRNREPAEAIVGAIVAEGGQATMVLGDVTEPTDAARIVIQSVEAMGGIDILVNNAGGRAGSENASTWFDLEPEGWADTYQKNVVAALRLIRLVVPEMKARGWGRLIQIASVVATTPTSSLGDYSASKAGLVNLTLGASKALANTGVTSNVVSPGMILTPAVERWLSDIGRERGWGDDRARSERFALDNYVRQTVERLGEVDDIANIVAYLSSPLADFINGSNIRVDGGQSPSTN